MDFERVLGAILTFLKEEGARLAVVGGLGLQAYGLSRATFDLDLVTESAARSRFVPYLKSLGYETLHASAGYSNHLHPDRAWGRVDVIYVDGNTSRQLFAGATKTLTLGGHTLSVPRAEHLVAMKVQAMKNDPGRTLQDLADVQFLSHLPGVDENEVRDYFERAGLKESYDALKRLG